MLSSGINQKGQVQLIKLQTSYFIADHLATNIQLTYPLTRTTVREDQQYVTKLYERLRGRLLTGFRTFQCVLSCGNLR